jgi:hypothetical protein
VFDVQQQLYVNRDAIDCHRVGTIHLYGAVLFLVKTDRLWLAGVSLKKMPVSLSRDTVVELSPAAEMSDVG